MTTKTNVTVAQALRFLAQAEMHPFDETDWDGYAGCESTDPMIGRVDDYTLVLDGDCINVMHEDDEGGGQMFRLSPNLAA